MRRRHFNNLALSRGRIRPRCIFLALVDLHDFHPGRNCELEGARRWWLSPQTILESQLHLRLLLRHGEVQEARHLLAARIVELIEGHRPPQLAADEAADVIQAQPWAHRDLLRSEERRGGKEM